MADFTNAPVIQGLGDSGAAGTATGASSAETLNGQCGVVTTEALTTASAGTETRTLTNSSIATTSRLFVTVVGGTNTRNAIIVTATPAAGSATIKLYNAHASALNGTVIYSFLVL